MVNQIHGKESVKGSEFQISHSKVCELKSKWSSISFTSTIGKSTRSKHVADQHFIVDHITHDQIPKMNSLIDDTFTFGGSAITFPCSFEHITSDQRDIIVTDTNNYMSNFLESLPVPTSRRVSKAKH